MNQTDRRFHGTLEDIENISFHPRQPHQITDKEAEEKARDLDYDIMGQNGQIDKDRINVVKEAIARTEQPSPELDAIVAALKHGQN